MNEYLILCNFLTLVKIWLRSCSSSLRVRYGWMRRNLDGQSHLNQEHHDGGRCVSEYIVGAPIFKCETTIISLTIFKITSLSHPPSQFFSLVKPCFALHSTASSSSFQTRGTTTPEPVLLLLPRVFHRLRRIFISCVIRHNHSSLPLWNATATGEDFSLWYAPAIGKLPPPALSHFIFLSGQMLLFTCLLLLVIESLGFFGIALLIIYWMSDCALLIVFCSILGVCKIYAVTPLGLV
jgi:hypothetical protein